ncbi:hypothetical protein GCM10009545_13960 [Saccharopolyspora thermophila]|uniref:Uncharacterized protein n=2 Tax=Saccharopolyspora thermophila TaxID=89367 RepID=A0ABN1C6Z8_9PSEU
MALSSPERMRRAGDGVKPLTLKELAELLRSGAVEEGPLADFAVDYREASQIFRKKDD